MQAGNRLGEYLCYASTDITKLISHCSNLEEISFNINLDSGATINLKNNSDSKFKITHVAVYNTISTFDLVSPVFLPFVLDTSK